MLIKSGKTFRVNVLYYTIVCFRHPLCFVQQISSVPVRRMRNLRNAEKLSSSVPINTRVLLWQHSPFHPYIRKQSLLTTCTNTSYVWSAQFCIKPIGIYCYHYVVRCETIYWKIYATSRKHTCFIPDGVISSFMDFKFLAELWAWVRLGFNRNWAPEGGKYGRCLGLTNLQRSCADCLEILGASKSWSPRGLSRTIQCSFNIWNTEKIKPLNLNYFSSVTKKSRSITKHKVLG